MSSPALEKYAVLAHYITMKSKFLFMFILLFVPALAAAQSERPFAYDVAATSENENQIDITWMLPKGADSTEWQVIVYRTDFPTIGSRVLEDVQPLAVLPWGETSYTDTVYDDKEYFYTIMIRQNQQKEFSLVIPAVNTTALGIRPKKTKKEDSVANQNVALQETPQKRKGELRELPLPYLNLSHNQESSGLISEQTEENAVSLAKSNSDLKKIQPHIFRNEQGKNLYGDHLTLHDIVQNYFAVGKYSETIKQINEFLKLNREQEITARSLFYLGESYFYTGNHSKALESFLAVQKYFPELTARWIQLTLDMYSIPLAN